MTNKEFAKRLSSIDNTDFNFFELLTDVLCIAYANDDSAKIHDMFRLLSWCEQKDIKEFKDYPSYYEEINPNSYEWDIWLLNHGFVMKPYDDGCVDFVGHNIIMHREEEKDRIFWGAVFDNDEVEFDLNPLTILLKNYTQEQLNDWAIDATEKFKKEGEENRKKCLRRHMKK